MEQATRWHVDPTNADQARAWDGEEGAYWAAHARRFDESVAAYHRPFLDASEIGAADRVIDLGCGTGQTTRDAGRQAADGSALGVDLSAAMVKLARELAVSEGLANVRFERGDAQIHPFEVDAFDVAISRTGAMFFGDPVAAFGNTARALRRGGRLSLLSWQPLARNEWLSEFRSALAVGRRLPEPRADAPGPFTLSQPDHVRALLTRAGFTDVRLEGLVAPLYFGPDAADAFDFVLGLTSWMLEGLDDAGRAQALDALRGSLAAHETGAGVRYESAAWIVIARKT